MNDYFIHQMFYIPLFHTKLEGIAESIKNEIINPVNFCYNRQEEDKGWCSNTHQLLNIKTFEPLKQKIVKALNVYVRDVLRISSNLNFKIVSSWAVKHKQNDFAKIHFHSNSIISGVYYPIVNEHSGKIWFYRETPLFTTTVNIYHTDYNLNNCTSYYILPVTDSLILFPSTIKHSVDENQSMIDRFAIGFNVFFEGNFSNNPLNIDNLNVSVD